MFCASLIFSFHLSPFTLHAQQPVLRHQCWDIDVSVDASRPTLPPSIIIARADTGLLVVAKAKEYIGTPYRYAGRTPKAFDCAGYVLYIYSHFGHSLPGWCGAQARLGVEVSDTRNLQPGDLVFFGGRHQSKVIGHTGIVVSADSVSGRFKFIHASTTAGVIISNSTEDYYKSRYITARRILK